MNPSTIDMKLNIDVCCIEFSTDWMTDWLTNQLISSERHNLILAMAKGMGFSLINVTPPPRCAFLLTATAPMLTSWLYQSLPLFSFVLQYIPFSTTAYVMICDTRVMASVWDLGKCSAASRSTSYNFLCYAVLSTVCKVAGNKMQWLSWSSFHYLINILGTLWPSNVLYFP